MFVETRIRARRTRWRPDPGSRIASDRLGERDLERAEFRRDLEGVGLGARRLGLDLLVDRREQPTPDLENEVAGLEPLDNADRTELGEAGAKCADVGGAGDGVEFAGLVHDRIVPRPGPLRNGLERVLAHEPSEEVVSAPAANEKLYHGPGRLAMGLNVRILTF